MPIPIIDRDFRIVCWTAIAPDVRGFTLQHADAERLLGTAVRCLYVELTDPRDSRNAGAPPDWQGPWRCLAICSADAEGATAHMPRVPVV